MMSNLFLFLFTVQIVVIEVSAQDGHKESLPTLPPAFQVAMQGSFLESMSVVEGDIYYDSLNNMASIKVVRNNSRRHLIYDFPFDQILELSGPKCEIRPIPDNNSESFFPFEIKDHKKTLQKSERFFELDGDNQTYLGQVSVRGILSDVWESSKSFSEQKMECQLRHYFTNKSWDSFSCNNDHCIAVPWRMNVTCLDFESDGEQEFIDHIYDFFDFYPFVTDTNAFLQPEGAFCSGKKPDEPIPSLPKSFKAEIETEAASSASPVFTETSKLWFYGEERLLRIDVNGPIVRNMHNVFIQDLETKIQFSFNYTGHCSMEIRQDITSEPLSLLGIIEADEISQYAGKRSLNGKEYQVWSVAKSPEDTSRKEAYFIETLVSDGQNAKLTMVPTSVRTFTIDGDVVSQASSSKIYNFMINPEEWDITDISLCFSRTNKTRFQLLVNAQFYNKNNFITSLRKKLLEIMAVAPIRLNGIQLVDAEEDRTVVMATVTDDPSSAIGIMAQDATPTSREAFSKLETAVNSNNFQFEEMIEDEHRTYTVTKIKMTGMPGHRKEKPSVPSPGFSHKHMIGLAIGMGAIGLFIGTVWLIIFMRLRKRKPLGLLQKYSESQESQ